MNTMRESRDKGIAETLCLVLVSRTRNSIDRRTGPVHLHLENLQVLRISKPRTKKVRQERTGGERSGA
jgi:hypothetical protein